MSGLTIGEGKIVGRIVGGDLDGLTVTQVLALLSLYANVVTTTSDNKLGFYNHAAVAQQTGVAVSAAGIHAALVALGLITA